MESVTRKIQTMNFPGLVSRLNIYDPLELASTLLSYSRQIALSLVCMEHKSFVHRDLAARNVLMSKDGMICKVSITTL